MRKFVALQLQTRFTDPRRAHARRSCECAYLHRKIVIFPANDHRATRSGGRKPPVVLQTRLQARFQHITDNVRPTTPTAGSRPHAPVRPFVGRGTMLDSRGTAVGMASHRRLTPAARDTRFTSAGVGGGRNGECRRAGSTGPRAGYQCVPEHGRKTCCHRCGAPGRCRCGWA